MELGELKLKDLEILRAPFASLGFEIIHSGRTNQTTGPDMWVKKLNGRPLSVEIKKINKKSNGGFQVGAVELNRRKDDLIAIICSTQYVLIEPMSDHLKACSPKGSRQLTLLLGKNP